MVRYASRPSEENREAERHSIVGSSMCPPASNRRSSAPYNSFLKSNMFVALSKFVVANDISTAVKEAFCNRPHSVESAHGLRYPAPSLFWRFDSGNPLTNWQSQSVVNRDVWVEQS